MRPTENFFSNFARKLFSFSIFVVLLAGYAQAQDLPAPSVMSPVEPQGSKKAKIVYKEKSYYDFEDVLINGNVRKPDGSFIFRKSTTPFSSALNLKRSFIPELKESSTNTR